jgi:hypothetical protein
MIWSIAWKNVWRNRKRSLIVITAVLLGTTAGVFTSGLMKGWVVPSNTAVITIRLRLRLRHTFFHAIDQIISLFVDKKTYSN